MEDEIKTPIEQEQSTSLSERAEERQNQNEPPHQDYLPLSILVSAIIIAGTLVYVAKPRVSNTPGTATFVPAATEKQKSEGLEESVLPSGGFVLPVRWGDLGVKMVGVGVIDKEKFESIYAERGGLSEEERALLESDNNGQIKITEKNSGFLLNLFWALGLGTKNDILEKGPMNDSQYGGAGNFASTGGWTIARGSAMDHYSRHPLIVLTQEQQQLVERVAKNIYRPCCGNSTYFPDCNHGMAMLGLLELMASQGVSEEEMYKAALQVNAYWFPDTYLAIAQYFLSKGVVWENVSPQEALGANYSSSRGYRRILEEVTPPAERKGGGGCGV